MSFTTVEICAGGGGQALGLEMAGFHHEALVESEPHFCATLRNNRPHWNTRQEDFRDFPSDKFKGVDLLAGGVPCPPFSIAGRQLGAQDERDMFSAAVILIEKLQPKAVLLENVPGFATPKFAHYLSNVLSRLEKFGYVPRWKVLQAADYGVPQLRRRFVLVALQPGEAEFFSWPDPIGPAPTVGQTLVGLMGSNGWPGAEAWARLSAGVAPTIVGGSKLHGGADLGPTRVKRHWRSLAVDAMGVADEPPDEKFPESSFPKLTVKMVARIQSFPDDWEFMGGKTVAYRQVGNAFPPLFARAVGLAIRRALNRKRAPVFNGNGGDHSSNGNSHPPELPLFTARKTETKLC